MVVVTITKIGSGGPGWRTFAEKMVLVSITRIESGKMHQVGFRLIVF